MKMKQVRVSDAIPFFKDKIQGRFGLRPYDNPDKPAVFWGCDYTLGGMKIIADHKTDCVLVWAGTDALRMRREPAIYESMRAPHIHHIAQSSFIASDLTELGIAYKRVNVNCASPDVFQPCPLGKKVYAYAPAGGGNKYGIPILRKVIAAMPEVEFIVSPGVLDGFPYKQMPEVYAQCLMGLRLTPHDGLAHMVTEMGLMGRRCVWNGEAPGALSWRSADDIVRQINNEMVMRKTGALDVDAQSSAMAAFLDIGLDWLDTDFYESGRLTNGCGLTGGHVLAAHASPARPSSKSSPTRTPKKKTKASGARRTPAIAKENPDVKCK